MSTINTLVVHSTHDTSLSTLASMQVKRHFSADTRAKMDNAIRGATIRFYGSEAKVPPAAADGAQAAAAADGAPAAAAAAAGGPAAAPGRFKILGSDDFWADEGDVGAAAAEAAAPQGQEAASSAAAAAATAAADQAERQRLMILQLQADAATHGNKYARASEVFEPAVLQALRQGVCARVVCLRQLCVRD